MPLGRDLDYIIGLTRDALADIADEITGQIVNSAQAIVDVWEIDCEGKWIVYVKTGLTATYEAMWLLLTPSFNEILESYLHPKLGRRHGRRGQAKDRNRRPVPGRGSRLFFSPPIPDIDNAIADRIPGRGFFAGRKVGPGEFLFWTGIDVSDRFLWYWLLITATETFATTWQSEIIKSGKCNALNAGACQFTTPKQTPLGNNNLWFAVSSLINFHNSNLLVQNNGKVSLVVSTTEASCLIICLAYFRLKTGNIAHPTVWQVGVKINVFGKGGTNEREFIKSGTIQAGPNQETLITVDFASIQEDVNYVQMVFVENVVASNGFDEFECWADVAVSSRGVHVV